MKQCTACKRFKPKSEFNKKSSQPDGLHIYCRECQRTRAASYYKDVDRVKQVDRVVKANQRRNIEIRKYVWEYLLVHPCKVCGESDPIVLDFDHVRGKKKFEISMFTKFTHSLQVVKDEIKKCDVRCSNCHRRRHYRKPKWME
jgi:hypothetical protein